MDELLQLMRGLVMFCIGLIALFIAGFFLLFVLGAVIKMFEG